VHHFVLITSSSYPSLRTITISDGEGNNKYVAYFYPYLLSNQTSRAATISPSSPLEMSAPFSSHISFAVSLTPPTNRAKHHVVVSSPEPDHIQRQVPFKLKFTLQVLMFFFKDCKAPQRVSQFQNHSICILYSRY
jgi:hypothetical protein